VDGVDNAGNGFLLLHWSHASGNDGVGNQVANRSAQRFFAYRNHPWRPLIYVNLAFVGLSGRFAEWFSLGEDPSIWFSFVFSMALLSLILSKG
jgi:hypothetical protein